MDIDAVLRARFAAEAEAMEERELDLDSIVRRGKRVTVVDRGLRFAAVVAALAVSTFVATSLWGGSGTKGETFPDFAAPPGQMAALEVDASEAVTRFIKAVGDGNARGSWRMLTADAQNRVGSFSEWERERRGVHSFLSWVLAPDVDVVLTKFPPAAGDRFVATAVARPEGGRALLQPFPLVRMPDGQFLIDLASTTFDRSLSLEPLNPVFMSGVAPAPCPGDDCNETPEWPVVRHGDLFGVALEPSEKVGDVWFAIGSEWVAIAELDIAENRIVAEATFDGEGVTPGEQVFLVAIRTDEVLETYGYRVTVEE